MNNIEVTTSDLDIQNLSKKEKIEKLKERIFVLQMCLNTEQSELENIK
jgi:hypothetical protein